MLLRCLLPLFMLLLSTRVISQIEDVEEEEDLLPTVLVVMLVRNKAHVLPFTLALLENLDYPKNRISIWIRSDHNEDSTGELLTIWQTKWKDLMNEGPREDVYHSLDLKIDSQTGLRFKDQTKGPTEWSKLRFGHIMELREEGLNMARRSWADWVWQLDADVFLTNPQILKQMIAKGTNSTIIAPVLNSLGLYSNFWAGMSEKYYYVRTDTYEKILRQKMLGCHKVPMVHSSVLINLRRKSSDYLTYLPSNIDEYDGPFDDIITFAISAQWSDVPMVACNDEVYGYLMLPLEDKAQLKDDFLNLKNLKVEMMAYEGKIPHIKELEQFIQPPPSKDSLGVDNVYMINLVRRPDRKAKMDALFDELGIKYDWVKAVDGKQEINEKYLEENQIKMMPEFKEPYHGRPITYGEIGCFMSHYNIWLDMIKKGYSKIIVLEDDIRFEPYFRAKIDQLHKELKNIALGWDLIFLGRKILHGYEEPWVDNSNILINVNYTYWTLGYLLSRSGAQKLVYEKPLQKIVPVDEYLPIMFDKHPKLEWKRYYHRRNLKAYSVQPLFLFPTHYTGDVGYFSDTEDSSIVDVSTSCDKGKNCKSKNDEL